MINAVFLIPVGPKDIERVAQTVKSIRGYCKDYRIFLLLDGVSPELLHYEVISPDIRIITHQTPTKGHWGKIWLRQCQALIEAARGDDLADDVIFVKIDADAVVVRSGFVERAQGILRTRTNVGQLGQCFSNIIGGRLRNRGWGIFFSKMLGWRGLYRFVLEGLRQDEVSVPGAVSRFLRFRHIVHQAEENGYAPGDFAVGGCYVLSKAAVVSMSRDRSLRQSPFLLLPGVGEDVVMTLYLYHLGYSAADDTSDGGIFAVEGKHFRSNPRTLKARGHYVLHPVKYGYEEDGKLLTESELVDDLLADLPQFQKPLLPISEIIPSLSEVVA